MVTEVHSGSVWSRSVSLLRVGMVGMWTVFWTMVALIIHLLSRRHAIPLAMASRGRARVEFSDSYLFVANHTSQLDIPVLFAALPIPLRFLAKVELRRIPLVGRFISAMGMVFVDRRDGEAARRSIDELASSLANGMSLMAFPEGTRSRGGELRPFKTGAFVAAIKSGAPVVPVYIEGASSILPADSLRVSPGRVIVTLGTPIPSRHLGMENRRELADLVRSKMMELGSLAGREL